MMAQKAYQSIVDAMLPLYGAAEAASIARIVMEDAFGVKGQEYKHKCEISPEEIDQLQTIIYRLRKEEPVQYVVGKALFYGLEFRVTPEVLIPRQETEELVAWVLETTKEVSTPKNQPLKILDIGTGSGCIPITLKHNLPFYEVHGLDVSSEAIDVAKENAQLNKVEVQFYQADIFDKNNWAKLTNYDIIVSNPPYITEDEQHLIPRNVLSFEPHLALFAGGNEAQRFIRVIREFATKHLNKEGFLFFETNEFHASDSVKILEQQDFKDVICRKDLNGKDRMIRARKI